MYLQIGLPPSSSCCISHQFFSEGHPCIETPSSLHPPPNFCVFSSIMTCFVMLSWTIYAIRFVAAQVSFSCSSFEVENKLMVSTSFNIFLNIIPMLIYF